MTHAGAFFTPNIAARPMGSGGGQDGDGAGPTGGPPPREIPEEIDDHYRLFGKEPWEVDYREKCELCDAWIDEYGLCACDSGGE